MAVLRGQWSQALQSFGRAIEVFRRYGIEDSLAAALLGESRVHLALLDYPAARRASDEAERIAQGLENPVLQTQVASNHARLLVRTGELAAAARLLDTVPGLADEEQAGELRVELARLAPQQHRDAVPGPRDIGFELRQRRERGRKLRLCARHVEIRAAACFAAGLGQLERAPLHLRIAPGNVVAALQSAQLEIVARDFARDAHQRVFQRGHRALELGAPCLVVAAHSPEEVELPGRIEPRVVDIDRALAIGDVRRLEFAELGA